MLLILLSLLLGAAVLGLIQLGVICHHLADLKAYTRTVIAQQRGQIDIPNGWALTKQ